MNNAKKRLSAAELASNELIRGVTQQRIDGDLLDALRRAKVWYALHGKKFTMPTTNGRTAKR
jgi:hypothetical protein